MDTMKGQTRPDPDKLLARLKQEERESAHGRLKIFFSYAPGVGKTYAMLMGALAQVGAGVDLVVG
jgi:two-component system sensor histidine kinase KdpD